MISEKNITDKTCMSVWLNVEKVVWAPIGKCLVEYVNYSIRNDVSSCVSSSMWANIRRSVYEKAKNYDFRKKYY